MFSKWNNIDRIDRFTNSTVRYHKALIASAHCFNFERILVHIENRWSEQAENGISKPCPKGQDMQIQLLRINWKQRKSKYILNVKPSTHIDENHELTIGVSERQTRG